MDTAHPRGVAVLQFGTVDSNCRWNCYYYMLWVETGCRSICIVGGTNGEIHVIKIEFIKNEIRL